VLVAVLGSLLFAVAVNDLADESIDRVNLPTDARRPLVAGTGTRVEMIILATTSAVFALAASLLLRWPAPLVVAGGLAITAAYSLRPIRIADRGVVAPMLLPAGYVAVPYLLGIFAVHSTVTRTDLLLLAGLYAGFIGRIVLKDFRDVRGDALFGKRTFLVRHGRVATCRLSATFLVVGVSVLPFVRQLSVALVAAYVVYLVFTLGLLRALARSTSARRDTALIAAIAIFGRGMLVTLYAHFALLAAHWNSLPASAAIAALAVVVTGTALDTLRTGPITDSFVPAAFAADDAMKSDPGSA
jgi:4-hydroxybenzoate polyprenyltransferase